MAINQEAFFMYLSTFCDEFPSIVSQFEQIYIENKERFFTTACKSTYYNHPTLSNGNLLLDVTHRRIFGVLLASADDEILYKRICNMFCSVDNSLKTCAEKLKLENFVKFMQKLSSYKAYDKRNFFIYALAYCLMADEVLLTPQASILAMALVADLDNRANYHPDRLQKIVDGIDPFKYLNIDAQSWKVSKKIASAADIKTLSVLMSSFYSNFDDDDLINQTLISDFKKAFRETDKPEFTFWTKIALFSAAFNTITEYYGLDIGRLLRNTKITKADQQFILKMLAFSSQQLSHNYSGANNVAIQFDIDAYDYYTTLILYLFIKNFQETKEFYFENNNETLFSQVSSYREKNEKLAAELAAAEQKVAEEQARVELLRQQIEAMNQSTAKEAKAQFKPYLKEISSLRKQVESLEEQLADERSKAPELNALRELAFSVKNEYVPEDKDIKLEDLIKDKKIVILGGHIEWRNKLKKKFPTITTLDGHNANADFSILDSASIVFLNTSNMSHSVYYKVIDILRNSNVPFDYLGRFINQDLFEKEVAALIQKHSI